MLKLKNKETQTLHGPAFTGPLEPGWTINPDLYQKDIHGEFLLKKDGTPKLITGKKKGDTCILHSETKAKNSARRSYTRQKKIEKSLKDRVKKASEKVEKAKETLKTLDGTSSNKLLTTEDLNRLPYTVREQIKNEETAIVFVPNKGPQNTFLASSEKDILFGGAAGGGKSYAMLADPLRFCIYKEARALIIRRTMPELRELIDKSHELYKAAFPGATFKIQGSTWTFPSGAKLEFGYCEKDSDVYRYQGQAYTWIGFDELTQWPTEFCWNYLGSRLRSIDSNIPTYLRATANPGGVGGHWVKKRYIDPAPANEAFTVAVQTSKGVEYITRKFIPSRLKDNPYLYYNSDYELQLAGLPPVLRKQLLEGNWDVVDGAAFPEFEPDIHVIAPFEIPIHWERVKGIDYGYASESACLWLAVDPDDGTGIIYRELYMKGLTGDRLGAIIREMEKDEARSIPGVLDGSAWSQMGGGYKGPTVGEVLVKMGHKLRRADKNRIAGKIQFHEHLRCDPNTGRPRLQMFNSCPNLIREMQSLPLDKNNPEDVDTHAQDHAYDAVRYILMSRPRLEGHMQRMARFKSEVYQPADPTFGY